MVQKLKDQQAFETKSETLEDYASAFRMAEPEESMMPESISMRRQASTLAEDMAQRMKEKQLEQQGNTDKIDPPPGGVTEKAAKSKLGWYKKWKLGSRQKSYAEKAKKQGIPNADEYTIPLQQEMEKAKKATEDAPMGSVYESGGFTSLSDVSHEFSGGTYLPGRDVPLDVTKLTLKLNDLKQTVEHFAKRQKEGRPLAPDEQLLYRGLQDMETKLGASLEAYCMTHGLVPENLHYLNRDSFSRLGSKDAQLVYTRRLCANFEAGTKEYDKVMEQAKAIKLRALTTTPPEAFEKLRTELTEEQRKENFKAYMKNLEDRAYTTSKMLPEDMDPDIAAGIRRSLRDTSLREKIGALTKASPEYQAYQNRTKEFYSRTGYSSSPNPLRDILSLAGGTGVSDEKLEATYKAVSGLVSPLGKTLEERKAAAEGSFNCYTEGLSDFRQKWEGLKPMFELKPTGPDEMTFRTEQALKLETQLQPLLVVGRVLSVNKNLTEEQAALVKKEQAQLTFFVNYCEIFPRYLNAYSDVAAVQKRLSRVKDPGDIAAGESQLREKEAALSRVVDGDFGTEMTFSSVKQVYNDNIKKYNLKQQLID